MRISIGSDHRGIELKQSLTEMLQKLGHEVLDQGPCEPVASIDYPDIGAKVAHQVSAFEADRGILICGSGVGMAITANKFRGVRAAVCEDEARARLCRQHNDVNVLCLSGDEPERAAAPAIVSAWLETEFEGGRHARRVDKISALEQQNGLHQ
jgi:ribose 5-phosphate isomerase B